MTTNTFAYNGFGARVSKSDSSGTTTYLRSGTSVVAPVVADSQAVYTPGISERRGSASRFYHGDIKNFVEQTDSSGQIVSSQQYDAFGNLVSSTGTWSGPFAYGGRFGYQSDSDTSLSLLGHRYYDPTTGRFLTRDPIGDGRNWYVYVANNPIGLADPTGLQVMDPIWFGRLHDAYWGIFGEPALDPEGKKVWVGGLINLINPRDNAMTAFGWTLINDREMFELYVQDPYWRNHEHHHLWQEEQMGTFWFLVEIGREYARWGHDLAPLEIDAENHSGKPWREFRDPWLLENWEPRSELAPPAHGPARQPWGGLFDL